jgi:hypothetical protein
MTPSPLHQPVVPLTLASILLLALTPAALPAPANPLTFEKDIRPILKAHCFDCHGEGDSPRGGLDLRLRRLMLQGGDEGPAITPGNPAQSRLLHLLESGAMPKRDRKPSRAEIDLVRDWIAAGAPTARPEPAELPKGTSGITEEERAFWSFQPIQPAPIPHTSPRDRARTPIDAFLRAAMPRDLAFAPDADRLTLLRRACFDLTGLPPTPEQIDTFLADTSPHAYETLVDRLLASPHYGERWGRHWLDVAGYADSEGYNEADPPRSHAYKYRDYVIRALNEDKPFDRFLTEQLAGDELARASHANASQVAVDSAANRDLLIATGFLRMGADGSAQAAPADHETVRNQVVADTLRIVTSSLLGLTVGCAQCHDHRYDPIPQADYYRLRAVFEPALDHRQWRNPADRRVSLHTDDDRRRSSEIEAEAARLAAERETQLKRFIAEALAKHLEKFEPHLRDPLRTAFETPADKRTPEQRKLLADHPSVNINAGVLYQYNPKAAEDLKAMDNRIAEVRSRKPPEDFIRALTEPPGHQPVTHLFHRGDPRQPRDPVGPGALSVLSPDGSPVLFPPQDPELPTSGRRLAFARWLTSGTNPLVARVLVNRVWMHHFGRGLVGTPADFGTMGEKPSHPELLDWLAADFMRHGWRLKRLHRLILTSTAYRQSSLRSPDLDDADPDNRHYARQSVRRLDAEVIRDSMLAASGALNTRMFGPPVPVRPDVHGQIVVGEDRTEGDNKMPVDVPLHGEEFRRSVYIQVRRSRPLAMLHAFDAPVMEVNCERRQSSTVATQSLMLMNSAFVLDQSNRLAERLTRETAGNPHAQVRKAWLLAFQRPPRPSEVADSVAFLQRQTALFASEASNPPAAADAKTGKSGATPKPTPENLALAHFCQVLLSANEFLYLD